MTGSISIAYRIEAFDEAPLFSAFYVSLTPPVDGAYSQPVVMGDYSSLRALVQKCRRLISVFGKNRVLKQKDAQNDRKRAGDIENNAGYVDWRWRG